MISAIVLATEGRKAGDLAQGREIVVRSLVWLVSAVVSGVVRDVTLATPAGLGLADVADHSGCNLVQAESEAICLQQAVAGSRTGRILIVRAGYEPDHRLIEDLESFIRRSPPGSVAFIRAAPETWMQRLWPDRAPVVGLLVPKVRILDDATFARLRSALQRGTTLRTRAVPIV